MKYLAALYVCFFVTFSTFAEIVLSPVFTDHMVLQREQPVRIWGRTTPRHEVIVRFSDQVSRVISDENGTFTVWLKPLSASTESRDLTITGDGSVKLRDILVGDVWLASGQSNMDKPLGERKGQRPTDNYQTEIAAANHSLIRLFQVPHHGEINNEDYEMTWLQCSPDSLENSNFSAVAYYFAREIHYRLQVPVGIIHSSFGGTMIEAWTPHEYLEKSVKFASVLSQPYFAWVEGVQASELYESMIRDMQGFSLKGFIWYQGEQNLLAGDIHDYSEKMELLVKSWRELWNNSDAPFYYVQLAPFAYSSLLDREVWLTSEALPLFWEKQTSALRIPHTGMIVTTDLAGDGHDIHPTNKRDVGIRLGQLALQETYRVRSFEAKSPTLSRFEVGEGGTIRLFFDNVGEGLHRSDGNTLGFFEVAGKNRHFVPAAARIVSDCSVVVSTSIVEEPVVVRFAWSELATPNLVNSNGLPVIPFRTDDWGVLSIQK